MKVFNVLLTLLTGLLALVQAQGSPDKPNIGNTNFDMVAGGTFEISWFGAVGPVTIILRNGDSNDLGIIGTITVGAESDEDGSGTFVWEVPEEVSGEGPYAFEIVDEREDPNFSEQFPIPGVVVTGDTTTVSSASATETTSVVTTSDVSTTLEPTTSGPSETLSEASETSATPTESQTPLPTEDDDDSANGLGSPLALMLLSLAAMVFVH